jgi:hypothetical protein
VSETVIGTSEPNAPRIPENNPPAGIERLISDSLKHVPIIRASLTKLDVRLGAVVTGGGIKEDLICGAG